MKNIKKIAALCALATVAGLTSGCGKENTDPNKLHITVVSQGFKHEWANKLAEKFQEKTGIGTEVHVLVGQAGNETVSGDFKDRKAGYTDVYCGRISEFYKRVYEGKQVNMDGVAFDNCMVDLTSLLEEKVDGENVTLKEKISDITLDYYTVDGKVRGLQYADGIMGLMRNKDVWNSLNLTDADMPLTTNDMFALADRVGAGYMADSNKPAPFIYCDSAEYYTSMMPLFLNQYMGKDNMDKFNAGLDPLGEETHNLFNYKGQEKALEIIQKLVTTKEGNLNKYNHSMSYSADFETVQAMFLERNLALFMFNGSWVETEQGEDYNNIDFIRTPVISSIIELTPSITSDAMLHDVIKAIDEGKTSFEGVTKADFDRIVEARNCSYMKTAVDHNLVIPGWSDKIEDAKKFIKFMYSDEGLKIYYETMKGGSLPAKLSGNTGDYPSVELSNLRKSTLAAIQSNQLCQYEAQHKNKIFCLGGVNRFFVNGCDNMVVEFQKGKTAKDIININKSYLETNWQKIEKDAGRI